MVHISFKASLDSLRITQWIGKYLEVASSLVVMAKATTVVYVLVSVW